MTTSIREIGACNPEWDKLIAPVPHDFYHAAAYHSFSEKSGEGSALLAVCGTQDKFLAWPYLLRSVPDLEGRSGSSVYDVASVYGYPGPLVHGCSVGDPFVEHAWQALLDYWRSKKVIAVFTRFHPLLRNDVWASQFKTPHDSTSAPSGVQPRGQTVSLDLTLTEECHAHNYQKVLRQEINHGRRVGLITELDPCWVELPEFVRLYALTMSYNGAPARYFFDEDYFLRLRRALFGKVHLFVTRITNHVAAAGIFVQYRGIVQAHFAGINNDFRSLSPLKVLLDDVRRWASVRGDSVLHLGGGRAGRDDTLFAFKARFSPNRHPFFIGQWVLNQELYDTLREQRVQHAARAGYVAGDVEYFPAYRAPLGSHASAPPPNGTNTAVASGRTTRER